MFTCRNRLDVHLKKMNFHRNRMDVYWNRIDVHWNRKNAHRNRRNVQWKGIAVHWNRMMDVFIGTEWIFTETFWVCTGVEQNTYTVLYILENSRFSQAENRHLAAIAFGQSKLISWNIFLLHYDPFLKGLKIEHKKRLKCCTHSINVNLA